MPDPWTPFAVALGFAIKPIMDKLCDSRFWERYYRRKQWRTFFSNLSKRK